MKFNLDFLKKKILIISDFDDTYSKDEKELEASYIKTFRDQIHSYNVQTFYEEVFSEKDLKEVLAKYSKNDFIIFNWCERLNNTDGTEALATKIYEELGFTFTGGNTAVLELLSDKYRCIVKLKEEGFMIPDTHFVTKESYQNLDIDFSKQYIVKSNNLHASTGISKENFITSKDEYLKTAKNYAESLQSDLLVQEYIDGEEYTAVVWGNDLVEALPILHLNFPNKSQTKIFTSDAKFQKLSNDYINDPYTFLEDENNIDLQKKIENTSIKAYKKLALIDYARVDFRVNETGIYIIDVNANPYINILQDCEVYLCTSKIGYNWGQTILRICELAYLRDKGK